MIKVIGVRFRQAGKIYFFAPGKYHIEVGEHVIVETARGMALLFFLQEKLRMIRLYSLLSRL